MTELPFISGVNFSAFRAFRALRALRTMKHAQGLRQIVDTFIETFRGVINVLFVYLYFVFLFATLGIDLFQGTLQSKCVVPTQKDLFHTTKEAEVNTLGPDDDGVSKCRLPEGVKYDVTLFKKSLRELINDYLDDTRVVKQASCCGTGRVAFSKDVYKNKQYMEGIVRSIEREFNGVVKISTESIGKGRPAVGEEGW